MAPRAAQHQTSTSKTFNDVVRFLVEKYLKKFSISSGIKIKSTIIRIPKNEGTLMCYEFFLKQPC